MDHLIFTSVMTIGVLACGIIAVIATFVLNRLKIESRRAEYTRLYAEDNQSVSILYQDQNDILLELAMEVIEFRYHAATEDDQAQKAQYDQSINALGTEMVDTVLAFNDYNLHASEEDEDTNTVLYFSDYNNNGNH